MPMFRRIGYFVAYGEGWGLYAERLGYDMGLYDDPYDRMGQLAYDMWRAVRLVVDTGMHSKGWSRDKAIAYFMDNAPKTARTSSTRSTATSAGRARRWPTRSAS